MSSLRIPIPVSVKNLVLDPHKMEDAYSMMIVLQIYRGLFQYQPDGKVTAGLVESWTESVDKKTYVFTLKKINLAKSLTLKSSFVLHSFARLFYLDSGMSSDLAYIKGSRKFKKSQQITDLGIKVIDERRIQFDLESPNPLFLKHLATVDCAILPIDNFKVSGLDPTLTTGPYQVSSRETGKLKLQLKDKVDKAPEEIIISEASRDQVFNLASEGKVDTIDLYQVETVNEAILIDKKKWKKVLSNRTGEFFVLMNPKDISPEVRDFLYSSIDPSELVKKLQPWNVQVAHGLVPPELKGSLEQSKKDLSAIYNGPKTDLKLEYIETSLISKAAADFLKERWEKKSNIISIQLIPLSVDSALERMFSKKSSFIIGNKLLDYPDGAANLNYYRSNNASNYFHASSSRIEKLLDQANSEFDQDKRHGLYKEIQIEVLKERTVIPLLFGSNLSGLWAAHISVPPHPLGLHLLPFELIEMNHD